MHDICHACAADIHSDYDTGLGVVCSSLDRPGGYFPEFGHGHGILDVSPIGFKSNSATSSHLLDSRSSKLLHSDCTLKLVFIAYYARPTHVQAKKNNAFWMSVWSRARQVLQLIWHMIRIHIFLSARLTSLSSSKMLILVSTRYVVTGFDWLLQGVNACIFIVLLYIRAVAAYN